MRAPLLVRDEDPGPGEAADPSAGPPAVPADPRRPDRNGRDLRRPSRLLQECRAEPRVSDKPDGKVALADAALGADDAHQGPPVGRAPTGNPGKGRPPGAPPAPGGPARPGGPGWAPAGRRAAWLPPRLAGVPAGAQRGPAGLGPARPASRAQQSGAAPAGARHPARR